MPSYQRGSGHNVCQRRVRWGIRASMQADEQLDQLVDEIARRVQARLTREVPATSASADAAGRPCETIGPSECDSCRGCHVKRPDDVRTMVRMGASRERLLTRRSIRAGWREMKEETCRP